jgi:hypothetical protein
MHMTDNKEWFAMLDDIKSHGVKVAFGDNRVHLVEDQGNSEQASS